jgi:formylglycine-generating enzyme required for sulfatase activity
LHAAAPDPKALYFDTVAVPGTDYRVARHEVTQAQYEEITGENPSQFPTSRGPVDSVSWDDAEAFCTRLTAREHKAGRLPEDWVYDLPTDAQWDQFAAGTEVKDAVTSLERSREHPEAVGSGKANPLGLYDVVGNVWEWCLDWYDNRIRRKDANPDMPYVMSDAEAAARGPEETFKVLRGGAWDTGAADGFTLGSRLRYAPSMANRRTGFRCIVRRKEASIPVPSPNSKDGKEH